MKVKLCGFTSQETLDLAVSQGCDFLGFVFCEKSTRFISPESAKRISKNVPSNISKVAVIVDPTADLLDEISEKLSPDFFQFHGSETPYFIKSVRDKFPKTKVIKAFRVKEEADLNQTNQFFEVADFFLFDSSAAGSGKKFDWEILRNFQSKKEWFLSGGINANNFESAIKTTGTKMIDISSGIEKVKGIKSSELILELMQKVKNYADKN